MMSEISPHKIELKERHCAIFAPQPDNVILPAHFPKYLLLQPEFTIPEEIQHNFLIKLDTVIDLKAQLHQKGETTRSNTSSFHFGVWMKYTSKPTITADTSAQTAKVQAAVDGRDQKGSNFVPTIHRQCQAWVLGISFKVSAHVAIPDPID